MGRPHHSVTAMRKRLKEFFDRPIKNLSPTEVVCTSPFFIIEWPQNFYGAIAKLAGSRLEKVIQITHEGVPEIRDVSSHLLLIKCDLI
jgi:hypothetical protein